MCQRLSISEEDVPGFPSVGRIKGSSLGSYMGMEKATAKVWPHQAAEVRVPAHLCVPRMDFFSH